MQDITKSVSYRFDFLKYRKIWIAVSIAYLLVGVVAYFVMGGFKYHIDFTGGAEIHVSFENPLDISAVRNVVAKAGWDQAVIQEIGNTKKEFLIKLGGALETGLEEKVKSTIITNIPGNKLEIKNVNWVGAEVSSDTTWNALKAIALSVLILLIYIAFRFEFAFGMGAVIALLHDLLFVLALILVTDEQVSLNVLTAI